MSDLEMMSENNLVHAYNLYQQLRKGDHVVSLDGDYWTVCYWFLDGVGVVKGHVDLVDCPDDQLPEPEAMLREPSQYQTIPHIGEKVYLVDND